MNVAALQYAHIGSSFWAFASASAASCRNKARITSLLPLLIAFMLPQLLLLLVWALAWYQRPITLKFMMVSELD
jgi:hypothetical protein